MHPRLYSPSASSLCGGLDFRERRMVHLYGEHTSKDICLVSAAIIKQCLLNQPPKYFSDAIKVNMIVVSKVALFTSSLKLVSKYLSIFTFRYMSCSV